MRCMGKARNQRSNPLLPQKWAQKFMYSLPVGAGGGSLSDLCYQLIVLPPTLSQLANEFIPTKQNCL